jgi:hypothetical protein
MAFPGIMFAIAISSTAHSGSHLRIDFGADYVYSFGLLNRRVDWRFLDARNWTQQQLIIDLVDAWIHDVFTDGKRRRACKWFVETIGEELVAYVFSPERITFDMLCEGPDAKN